MGAMLPRPPMPAPPPSIAARDLQEIAKVVVANPTIGKRILHSKFLSPHRRAVQSPGAAASYAASALKKAGTLALGQIPVPAVGSIIDKAWTATCDAIRTKVHTSRIEAPANLGERVKFELKEIGGMVEDWDSYRWKIAHSVEQFNKAVNEVKTQPTNAPCDTWVRVWAKYYYIGSRIAKLREKHRSHESSHPGS